MAATTMLKEGDKAPDFRLKAEDGREIALSDLRGKSVVLYFYPKANTPGCTDGRRGVPRRQAAIRQGRRGRPWSECR